MPGDKSDSVRERPMRNPPPPSRFEPGNITLMDLAKSPRKSQGIKPISKKSSKSKSPKHPSNKMREAPKHKKASVGAKTRVTAEQASNWTVDEVGNWLKTLGFAKDYVGVFNENDIDGPLLKELDDIILKDELGIAIQLHRKRILREISDLLTASDASIDDDSESEREFSVEEVIEIIKPRKERKPTIPKKRLPKKVSPRIRPTLQKKTPKVRQKAFIAVPSGKKRCPSCNDAVPKLNAMCLGCNHIFPESKTLAFSAVKYHKVYQSRPNYVKTQFLSK